ncbi:MAG: xanthine dehydrogenase family protein subunit M [Chloroflexi bacterium]|nr:xanthine dehydrogenase family protein subunit M [Chloroflexota bacterium]
MKPAPFEYVAPRSLDDALDALARRSGEAKILAGGQSLVPLLNMRLASPACLVDLNRLSTLAYVRSERDGIAIGAMTRAGAVEHATEARHLVPLLAEALPWVGHPQIRSRGTIGGSLAHADPAAELPAVAVCLDATAVAVSGRGRRTITAGELFTGYLSTALQPDEILTEVWFPRLEAGTGHAWEEFARRHGDYAIVGVGASISVDAAGAIVRARLALTGVGPVPVRVEAAEQLLVGTRAEPEARRAAADAVRCAIEPDADLHGTSAYRRRLAGVLVERAVARAAAHARASVGRGEVAQDPGRTSDALARRA